MVAAAGGDWAWAAAGGAEVHEQQEQQERRARWPAERLVQLRSTDGCVAMVPPMHLYVHTCRQLQISSSYEAVRDGAPSHSSPSDAPLRTQHSPPPPPLRRLLFCLRPLPSSAAVGTALRLCYRTCARRRLPAPPAAERLDGCNTSPQRLGASAVVATAGCRRGGAERDEWLVDRTFGQLARSWGSATPHYLNVHRLSSRLPHLPDGDRGTAHPAAAYAARAAARAPSTAFHHGALLVQ